MRIYIRHADKQYKNGHAPDGINKYDPDLSLIAQLQCNIIAEQLRDYPPDKIICSPYIRARRTAVLLCMAAGKNVCNTVVVDPNIGEYLGNIHDENIAAGIDPTTMSYNPPLYESMLDLDHRAAVHHRQNIKRTNTIIWYVTHGIFISKVLRYLGYNIKKIRPANALIIHDTDIEKIDVVSVEDRRVHRTHFSHRRLTDYDNNYED